MRKRVRAKGIIRAAYFWHGHKTQLGDCDSDRGVDFSKNRKDSSHDDGVLGNGKR